MGITIRVLEPDSNRRGDLFTLRMEDVLGALGYEQFVRDLARAGREIDITGVHRTEPQRVVVECKATMRPIGGTDLARFAGVLDLERRLNPKVNTVGYFISLSGFTTTGLEQEAEAEKATGQRRFVTMDGADAVRELIHGHVIVPEQQATERAGRCVAGHSGSLRLDPGHELVISQLGWVWVVYFASGKQRTGFALVHADGEPLAAQAAAEIIAADQAVGGSLHELDCLKPPEPAGEPEMRLDEAKAAYFNYLLQDYGSITLEGLPPDQEIGVRELKLEDIFVPLHLEPLRHASATARRESDEPQPALVVQRQPVGDVLTEHRRLAILAEPGAGKSTLVKRLAMAYGFPDRRNDADDRLPAQPWIPLVVRCRQLGDAITQPITEILQRIPILAEMPDLGQAFRRLISNALRSGNILLLVDGLDEIADEGQRVAFLRQLRTFLGTYPAVSVVVTSREAGFREIGSALADVCDRYRIADFDEEDVRQLTVAWYREVVGTDRAALAEAATLADAIIATDRVFQLARNPLLLTTLLMVKRGVGELPRRRSVLYDEAIKVLLRTWNKEGHEPIKLDQAIPQLAFVAYAMLDAGTQRISLADLTELLKQARQQMPEELRSARISVADFVSRIELRSSLLSMSGYGIEGGRLVPVYEFRHLTFQEYLSALAIVEGYYPDHDEHDTITGLLQPRFSEDAWSQVIPLAAVLAGRKAASLVEALIQEVKDNRNWDEAHPLAERLVDPAAILLAECLVDEVELAPPLAEAALQLIAGDASPISEDHFSQLLDGRYAASFRKAVTREFTEAANLTEQTAANVAIIQLHDLFGPIDENFTAVRKSGPEGIKAACERLSEEIADGDRFRQAQIIMTVAIITWVLTSDDDIDRLPEVFPALAKFVGHIRTLLQSSWEPHQYAACFAVGLMSENESWTPEMTRTVLGGLFTAWRCSENREIRIEASTTFARLPIVDRESRPLGAPTREIEDFLRKQYKAGLSESRNLRRSEPYPGTATAVFTAAYYLGAPWSDAELAELIGEFPYDRPGSHLTLLHGLGPAGRKVLDGSTRDMPQAGVDDV